MLNGIVPLSFPVPPVVSDPESTLNIGPESGIPEPDTAEIDSGLPADISLILTNIEGNNRRIRTKLTAGNDSGRMSTYRRYASRQHTS